MTVIINDVYLPDVFKIQYTNCEFCIIFTEEHRYSSMEEIESKLAETGIEVGNFYFNGLSCYEYDYKHPENKSSVSKETSILCVIPENLRDEFHIQCWQ